MQIQENIKLAPYTTFKIGGPARYFCVVKNPADAIKAYEFAEKNNLNIFILGGGSNVLISDDGFDGLAINVVNSGIEAVNDNYNNNDNNDVYLKVASGEIWDDVVSFAVTNGLWGIENLSHIPGKTGAIAVQNVGAYGQEAGKVIDSVEVFNKSTRQSLVLKNMECGFSYRKSIFNSEKKGEYIIFNVILRLKKNGAPELSYRDLKNEFTGKNPSLAEVRQAIIKIRNKKFPFPTEAKNGNAGSFFKNIILTKKEYEDVKIKIKEVFGNEIAEELEKKKFVEDKTESIKVPTAFLLEICGLKGMQNGGAAINQNQPLVIINQSGNATARDVINLAAKVLSTVKTKTGIQLKIEPELIGFNPEIIKTVL